MRRHSSVCSFEDTLPDSAQKRLDRLSSMSRILQAFFLAISLIAAVAAIISIVFGVAGVVAMWSDPGNSNGVSADVALVTLAFSSFSAMFFVASLVFRDIKNGESPFTEKQARRIRIIAWVLFAYSVIDTLYPKGLVVGASADIGSIRINRHESGPIGINVTAFAAALIFFFLSSVFKFGTELQELSKDVI